MVQQVRTYLNTYPKEGWLNHVPNHNLFPLNIIIKSRTIAHKTLSFLFQLFFAYYLLQKELLSRMQFFVEKKRERFAWNVLEL